MESNTQRSPPVRAGDLDGLRTVYSETGGLIPEPGEQILRSVTGWDVNVQSPWRKFLPKFVFMGFNEPASSRLFVTSKRIVLVREIDAWRELKGELTPLGVPAAAAKEARLKQLKSLGARQYCEITPRELRIMKMRSFDRKVSWMDLRLMGSDRKQYAITLWKTDGLDQETRNLMESLFRR